MVETDCRFFNGYRPCDKNTVCQREECRHFSSVKERVLIVHLGALGAVLRSTSLLAAIKRRYPGSHITWVTKAPADQLLRSVSAIDRVLTLGAEDLLSLKALSFDLGFVIDKSLAAWGVVESTSVSEVRGFRVKPNSGAVIPANPEAMELWKIGLSNEVKFHGNTKTEQHLVHEALALGEYKRDGYAVRLSSEEESLSQVRRKSWSSKGCKVIGINTGSSNVIPYKKLSVDGHRRVIQRILAHPDLGLCPIVLLGGSEDTERNQEIARGLPVIVSPTGLGLRDGLVSVNACDLVLTGDSLGMHMAIGLKKWVVAWFGPTCAHEIDLYDRGRKLLSHAPCGPCWKRVCDNHIMCYDQVDFNDVLNGLNEGFNWLTSYSKPPFQETSFSPSPF